MDVSLTAKATDGEGGGVTRMLGGYRAIEESR